MDLSKILAISGKGGLFKIVSQTKTGLIVESLSDGKKIPVFATHKSSILEDISMFTYGEDVPLADVFRNIFKKEDGGKTSVDPKADGNKLQAYFEEVLPDFDKERVYGSDIKKVLTWYNLLLEHKLVDLEEEAKEEDTDPEPEAEGKEKAEKAPAKKTPKKATATKTAKTGHKTDKTSAKKAANLKTNKKV